MLHSGSRTVGGGLRTQREPTQAQGQHANPCLWKQETEVQHRSIIARIRSSRTTTPEILITSDFLPCFAFLSKCFHFVLQIKTQMERQTWAITVHFKFSPRCAAKILTRIPPWDALHSEAWFCFFLIIWAVSSWRLTVSSEVDSRHCGLPQHILALPCCCWIPYSVAWKYKGAGCHVGLQGSPAQALVLNRLRRGRDSAGPNKQFLFSPAGVRPAACSGELREVHINNEFSRNDGVFLHLMKPQLRAVDFICEITF